MKNIVIKNALILGLSGILAKSFDFIFRAYYSRILGAEGMGLLSLGFGLHGVMLTVSTAGLGVAVSKITSEYIEQNRTHLAIKCVKTSMLLVCVSAITLILTILFKAEYFGENILGDKRISIGLCGLAPSILFMGISYCLKGYLYATRKVIIPALSEFLEQAIKFISISFFIKLLLPYGIEYGCFAVFLGISVGELSSCLYLLIRMFPEFRKPQPDCDDKILRKILKISLPSMLTALVGSTFRMQEEVWTVSSFKRYGMLHNQAISLLGVIYGMVFPLLTFPLTLSGSVMTLLIPEVSRANSHTHKQRLHKITTFLYTGGMTIGFIVFMLLFSFSSQLTENIYHNQEAGDILRKLAFLFPFMLTETISCAILNGLGKQCSLLIFSLTDSIIRLSAIIFLIPKYGTNALFTTIVFSSVFTCLLTFSRVLKAISFSFDYWRKPFINQKCNNGDCKAFNKINRCNAKQNNL